MVYDLQQIYSEIEDENIANKMQILLVRLQLYSSYNDGPNIWHQLRLPYAFLETYDETIRSLKQDLEYRR